MHNRQSGAAHVPIMFFLLLLIMLIAAVAFAWVTQTRNGELVAGLVQARQEADLLKKKNFLVEHYIADVGAAVGKPGKYEGREGQSSLYGGSVLDYPGLMNPKEIKAVMDKACGDAGVSIASSLENVLGALVTRINQTNQRVKDIENERDKVLADKTELERKFQQQTADNTKSAREWNQNLEQTRSDFTNARAEKDNNINRLTESLKAKNEELATTRETATATEKALNAQMDKIRGQNSALVARNAMIQPPDVADGKVIAAQQGVSIAFVNLGKKDMLQPGTIFRIRNPHSASVKGYATVKSIEEERAEVELSGLVDPIGDSVRAGDELFNDLFTPRATRTIYLLGRFQAPYNKPDLANLLKRLGNKVVDKMGPGVDTVILGNDPINEAGDGFTAVTDSKEYKEALDLRVEFAHLKNIRDLIKL